MRRKGRENEKERRERCNWNSTNDPWFIFKNCHQQHCCPFLSQDHIFTSKTVHSIGMPRPKVSKNSIKESGSKPVRLRLRSDSEINRLSGISLDKENGTAIHNDKESAIKESAKKESANKESAKKESANKESAKKESANKESEAIVMKRTKIVHNDKESEAMIMKRTKIGLVDEECVEPRVKQPESNSVDAAIDFMTNPKVSDADYWRKVAEECKEALSKTLEENEQLHDELDLLRAENEQLRQVIDNVASEAIIP